MHCARHAAELPQQIWKDKDGHEFKLIEDPEVREYYGPLIGLVAESHWWNVEELEGRLEPELLTPPTWMPEEWTVDAIKVACLLRVADAVHLDERRAPAFLRAIRKPEGLSDEHWRFQGRLGLPTLHGDRLLYTAGRPFADNEATAWWLCFDALGMVDREIRAVNELLTESHHPPERIRPPLAVTGVVGVEDPRHLARHVRTRGWKPVDTRVHVSDMPTLVERLGGKALYGDNPDVPLRELIANAADAIRARRVLTQQPTDWGAIKVKLGKDGTLPWLEVSDNGLGMSENVLTRYLLDFSKSFWNSDAMRVEHPGLAASTFSPTGRFGIGFFSVFMWGSRVRVTTRRYDESAESTRVLQFERGLKGRPVLMAAPQGERLIEGGTRVRVWFEDSELPNRLLEEMTLAQKCAWLAPVLDVDLLADETVAVKANDWLTLPGAELLSRINNLPKAVEFIHKYVPHLRVMRNAEGKPIGRAFISPGFFGNINVVVVDGLRATTVRVPVAGILLGDPQTAARDTASLLAGTENLSEWASEQASLLSRTCDGAEQYSVSSIIASLDGALGDLKCANYKDEWLSLKELASVAADAQGLVLSDFRWQLRSVNRGFQEFFINASSDHPFRDLPEEGPPKLFRHIAAALAPAWGVTTESILEASNLLTSNRFAQAQWLIRPGQARDHGPREGE